MKAAEEAMKAEGRNYSAWEALIAAKKGADTPVTEMDEIFKNGAKSFSRYADLEDVFMRHLCGSYDALTNPFLEHFVGEGRKDLAKTALEYTERRMDVEEDSQLEAALFKW
ncbi:MAG: hypothetical protein ACJAVK_001070 [Akkermansiaceae bacterium]|jgi:hypothetical protein